MNWVEILLAIATGTAGSGIVELVKKWAKQGSGTQLRSIDPDTVESLATDRQFCVLAVSLNADLKYFLNQLSVVYCEVIGVAGGSDDAIAVANPVEGRSIFVPNTVGFFWRNYHQTGKSLEELEMMLDTCTNEVEYNWIKSFVDFRKSVTRQSVLDNSSSIHSLLLKILAHSNESLSLFDSVAESIYHACSFDRPFRRGSDAVPILLDDKGNQLRFYTVWQDSRFIATNQAIALLTRQTDGQMKRRLSKNELIRAHYIMLSLFSVTCLLFESSLEIIDYIRNRNDALICEVRDEVLSTRNTMWAT